MRDISLVTKIHAVCLSENTNQGKVIIACDRKSALTKVGIGGTSARIEEKQQAFIYAIKHLLVQLPMKYKLWHVMGHQGNHKELLDMNELFRSNVVVYNLAKNLERN